MRFYLKQSMTNQRAGVRAMLMIAALTTSGCRTSERQAASAIQHFDNGSPQAVIAALDDAASAASKSQQQIIAIDRAIATAMAGDVSNSERLLQQARDRIVFLEQKDFREQAKSILTDDKAVAWTGRDFERRMVDNLLIIASLLGNHQDAFAYATQAMEQVAAETPEEIRANTVNPIATVGHAKQPSSIESIGPEVRLTANSLTAYLHAAVHSENAMNADVTDRSIRLASYWNGTNPERNTTISFGTKSRPGHGVVHVLTFVGRITDWQSERAAPTSAALLLADQILSAMGDHSLPPTIAPVMIAKPVCNISQQPLRTSATVKGQTVSAPISTILVDLNAAAMASYHHDRDKQIARAVVRRIVKKGAIYAAKDQLAVSNDSATDLLLNIGGIAWEAMEKADTRHLSLLPERVETLQMELPAGRHNLELQTVSGTGNRTNTTTQTDVEVDVNDGRNTFVLCFRNGNRFTQVVTESFEPGNRD